MLLKRKLNTTVGLKKSIVVKKKLTSFRISVFTRHSSHGRLRTELSLLPFRSVIRLGSTTPSLPGKIECNSIQGVKNSSSKLLMKQCFTRAGVKTADWWIYESAGNIFISNGIGDRGTSKTDLPYPIIAKSHFGSRGIGNTKLDTQEELETWMRGKTLSNYIFETFSKFSKEFRIHVSDFGCFYTNRKLLKSTAPEGTWQKHDDEHLVWILETNEAFKKPSTWNLIVEDCVKAKNALGLDICSFDVMCQGSNKENPEWIVVESQSAPGFGNTTLEKYLIEIPKVLRKKYEQTRR